MILNENLKRYLAIVLNKNINNINYNDIYSLETINISKMNYSNNLLEYNLSDLLSFPNLKNLIVNDSIIDINDIMLLSKLLNLQKLEFNHCHLKGFFSFSNLIRLNNLTINNCIVDNYNIFDNSNLKEFFINNPYQNEIIDINLLKKINNVKSLRLEKCNLINTDTLSNFISLEELSLLDSNFNNLNCLYSLKNLKIIFINNPQFNIKNIKDSLNIDVYSDIYSKIIPDYKEL